MTAALTDTHLHLIPGVDDGSPDMDASVEFARGLYDSGLRAAVCTPHLRSPDDPSLRARDLLPRVRDALATAGVPLELHLGFEIAFSMVAEVEVAELRRFGLAGSRYVLLEVPHTVWPAYAEEAVHRVRLAGMVPVLAHPERNERLRRSPDLIDRLVAQGAVLQGTGASLLGLFGRGARDGLLDLAARGRLDLLATDAHYDRPETWDLSASLGELDRQVSGLDRALMAAHNPASVIGDRPLTRPQPARPRGRLERYLRGVRG